MPIVLPWLHVFLLPWCGWCFFYFLVWSDVSLVGEWKTPVCSLGSWCFCSRLYPHLLCLWRSVEIFCTYLPVTLKEGSQWNLWSLAQTEHALDKLVHRTGHCVHFYFDEKRVKFNVSFCLEMTEISGCREMTATIQHWVHYCSTVKAWGM